MHPRGSMFAEPVRTEEEEKMPAAIYAFQCAERGFEAEFSTSARAKAAIEAAINERPGFRYQELTEPHNPKPMFAVSFTNDSTKIMFEGLFARALELSGLRVNLVRALEIGAIAQEMEAREFEHVA